MPEPKVTNDISAIKGFIEKHDKRLIRQMLNGLDIFTDLPGTRRNVRTEVSLNKLVVDAGVRPLNTAIESPKGKRTWSKRKLVPHYGMKIFEINPDDLRPTFMSEMLAPNAKREPFAAWAWQREFEKIAEEINDNFYLSEFHNDPEDWDNGTAYDAGDLVYFDAADGKGAIVYEAAAGGTNAAESPSTHPAKWADVDNKVLCDGPGTVIANEITGASISPIATGAYDDTDAYDAYMTQWDAIPEARKKKKIAYASFDSVGDLITHHNSKFGSGQGIPATDIEEGRSFTLKGTGGRLTVKPVTWMNSSRRIIMTDPMNLIPATDMTSDYNKVGKIVETLHGYKAIMKFMLTFQIADLEDLYVNDQA